MTDINQRILGGIIGFILGIVSDVILYAVSSELGQNDLKPIAFVPLPLLFTILGACYEEMGQILRNSSIKL